jgi:exosortase O
MTLPFGNIMDVYIGFPLRLIAVDSIASVFNSLGLQNVTSSTIITIENSATQIDFSCSGLKGIWSAILFYLSISWLDNLKLGVNWVLTFMLLIITIVAANIFRIFIIVSLNSLYHLPKIADTIHAPLGIIGFVFSCVFIYFLTKTKIYQKVFFKYNLALLIIKKLGSLKLKIYSKLKWTRVLLLIFIICATFFSTKRSNGVNQIININYPANWETKTLQLTKAESSFFKKEGSAASKIAFKTKQFTGSLLLVRSNGWRGHHNPEYCIRAGGNKINKLETIKINTDFPIKWMNVNDNASACFWFQSPTKCTDDFGTRVWSEIKNNETNWIMVSVVFNNHQTLEKLKINKFLIHLNQLIKQYHTTSHEQI